MVTFAYDIKKKQSVAGEIHVERGGGGGGIVCFVKVGSG